MVENLINKPYFKLYWLSIEATNSALSPLAYILKTDQAKTKLIQHLYQQPFAIKKDEFGKPYIDEIDEHISISHTKSACAILFTRASEPGMDIELFRPQLFKIYPKYLSIVEQEKHDVKDLKTLTILWSAKEAIFKWHGIGEVDFKRHIYIEHIDFENNKLKAKFLKTQYKANLNLEFMEHQAHIITYITNSEVKRDS